MTFFIRFFLGTAVLLFVGYILIRLGSTWRFSSQGLDYLIGGFNVISLSSDLFDLNFLGLTPPKIIHKNELDGFDALTNAFSLYVSCLTVFPFMLLVLLFALIYSVFTGDFFGFILGLLIGALALLVIPFFPLLMWLVMLFQEGTSNYHVLWFLLGIPAIGAAYSTLVAPYYVILIILKPV